MTLTIETTAEQEKQLAKLGLDPAEVARELLARYLEELEDIQIVEESGGPTRPAEDVFWDLDL